LTSAESAFEAGFLGKTMLDLSGLYDLSLLSRVLKEKGKRQFHEGNAYHFLT